MPRGKTTNRALFSRARRVLVGGVNSPARSFGQVGGVPRFVVRAKGSRIWDEDGREFIDYVCAWGPLLFGHNHAPVVTAVRGAAQNGVCFGMPARQEVELATLVTTLCPHLERARFTTSGTEAVLTALKLARAITGRTTILAFTGGYHGHAGLGSVFRAPYNNVEAVRRLVRKHRLAAILVEPVAANMGLVPPRPGFLESLRTMASECGAQLVFDEVVTGFRLGPGGAAEAFGIVPDLTVFGKVLGGGMPIGAVAGPSEVMSRLAPEGPVFHAGTFAGHPLTMAAGVAQLSAIDRDRDVYHRLERRAATFATRLEDVVRQTGAHCHVARVGSMWTIYFTRSVVTDWASAARANRRQYASFFHHMLKGGVHLVPSQWETNFISDAHTARDLAVTADAVGEALITMRAE